MLISNVSQNKFKIKFLANQAIVINLIRFINEFWFVANKEIVTELEDKIKSDTNLSSTAPPLINKIKQFDSLNNMVKL